MLPYTGPRALTTPAFISGFPALYLWIPGLMLIGLTGCSADFGTPLQLPPSAGGPPVTNPNVTPETTQPPVTSNPSTPATEPVPTVSFTSTPVFCCDPRSIVFEAATDTDKVPAGTQFHWEFGDGRTGDGQRVEHTYAWPGNYTVVLKADFRDGSVRSTDAKLSLPADPAPQDQPTLTPSDDLSPPQPPSVPVQSVVAVAGDDRMASPGTWIVLDGSASHGSGTRPLAYVWRQFDGIAVSLVNPTHAATTFLAPSDLQEPVVLTFELTVVQNGLSGTDQVQIALPCTKCTTGNDPNSDPGNTRNDDAIAQVLSGQLTTANASWWGFDPTDATTSIQNAIWSGAKTVVVPDMGKDWIVRPLFLVSNQEIVFEPRVVLYAKAGMYHDPGDCLLTGNGVTNVTLRGYGATLRMRKADYMGPDYSISEYRHALSLMGVQNVQVLGLTFQSSGGDGIYVGPTDDSRRHGCRDLVIRDCVCDDNYRQGVSVISAENLTIDHCTFSGTIGTAPQAGIDLEPSDVSDRMVNIEITNCSAIGNAGTGFMTNLVKLQSTSQPVSIHFLDCDVQNSRQPGLRALLASTGAPGGFVEFENCTAENTQYAGLACLWNLDSPIALRFVGCQWNKVARYAGELPIYLALSDGETSAASGGITFDHCTVIDDRARDTVGVTIDSSTAQSPSVSGVIMVVNSLITDPISSDAWPLPNLSVQMQNP